MNHKQSTEKYIHPLAQVTIELELLAAAKEATEPYGEDYYHNPRYNREFARVQKDTHERVAIELSLQALKPKEREAITRLEAAWHVCGIYPMIFPKRTAEMTFWRASIPMMHTRISWPQRWEAITRMEDF